MILNYKSSDQSGKGMVSNISSYLQTVWAKTLKKLNYFLQLIDYMFTVQ